MGDARRRGPPRYLPGRRGALHHGLYRLLAPFAESTNLITWQRIGPLIKGKDNKDHVLFPRKITGRYVTFHRRPPSIWIACSDDLQHWEHFQTVMGPRTEGWDCNRVGGGGVPIETEHGWLVIYHAYDYDHVYRLGVVLLDLDDPTQVIHRPKEPIFWPQEPWELHGDVPNVVFSAANPVVDGTVYVYYGGADRLIGLATCRLDELVDSGWTNSWISRSPADPARRIHYQCRVNQRANTPVRPYVHDPSVVGRPTCLPTSLPRANTRVRPYVHHTAVGADQPVCPHHHHGPTHGSAPTSTIPP